MISPDHEWLFDSTITSTAHGLALGRKGAHRNGHNLGSAGMLRLVYPIKPLFGTVNASFGFCLVRNHISFMAKNWECKPEQTWERLNRLPEGQRRGLPPPRSESFFFGRSTFFCSSVWPAPFSPHSSPWLLPGGSLPFQDKLNLTNHCAQSCRAGTASTTGLLPSRTQRAQISTTRSLLSPFWALRRPGQQLFD